MNVFVEICAGLFLFSLGVLIGFVISFKCTMISILKLEQDGDITFNPDGPRRMVVPRAK